MCLGEDINLILYAAYDFVTMVICLSLNNILCLLEPLMEPDLATEYYVMVYLNLPFLKTV